MNIRSYIAFSAFTSRPNSTLLTDKVSVSLFGEQMPELGHCQNDRGIGIRYYSLYRQEMSLDSNALRWALWTMDNWGGQNGRGVKPKIQKPESIRHATLRSLVAWVTWHPGLLKNGSNTKTALLSKKWQGLVLMRIYVLTVQITFGRRRLESIKHQFSFTRSVLCT